MNGKELLKNIAHEKMPDREQVRENCHNQILAKVAAGSTIKSGRSWRKRPVIIVMIISVLMLMGATGYYILIMRTVFDLDGNAVIQRFFSRNPAIRRQINEEDRARDIFELAFVDSITEPNRFIVINRAGCGRSNTEALSARRIHDYAEWQDFTVGLDSAAIMFPQYIPERFEFIGAYIRFFICESFDFDALELIRREEYLGNIYEEWYFPEELVNLNNISFWWTTYRCKVSPHEFVDFRFELSMLDETAHRTFGASHNDNPAEISEVLQIAQFENSLLLSTESHDEWHWFIGIDILGTPIPRISGSWGRDRIFEYLSASYYISGGVTRDEIMRIAESIR